MASDYSRKVSEALIEQLQRGTAPWQRPWKAGERTLPYNPTTDNDYRGINSIWLAAQGYGDSRWLTYKQAAAQGAQVRRGEKGTVVEYWKFYGDEPVKDAAGNVVTENGKIKTQRVEYDRPRVFHAVVFNAEQIDGMPPAVPRHRMPERERHELAESILQASGARIQHGGNVAAYSPGRDSIFMPRIENFNSSDTYYATALHELGHWTGHHTRLDRDLSHPFGSEGYAREELRAEIASLMVGDRIGLGHDPERHAAYVGSWIKALQEDPREIFRAAADAEKIQQYVLGLHQQQQQEQQGQVTLQSLVSLRDEALQADHEAAQAIAEARANPLNGPEEIREATQLAGSWRDTAWAKVNEAVAAAPADVASSFRTLGELEEALSHGREVASSAAFEAALHTYRADQLEALGIAPAVATPEQAQAAAQAAAADLARRSERLDAFRAEHELAQHIGQISRPGAGTMMLLTMDNNLADDGQGPLSRWNALQQLAEDRGMQAQVRLANGAEHRLADAASGSYVVEFADAAGKLSPIKVHLNRAGLGMLTNDGVLLHGNGPSQRHDLWTTSTDHFADAMDAANGVNEARGLYHGARTGQVTELLQLIEGPMLKELSATERAVVIQQHIDGFAASNPDAAIAVGNYLQENRQGIALQSALSLADAHALGDAYRDYGAAHKHQAEWATTPAQLREHLIRGAVAGADEIRELVNQDKLPTHLRNLAGTSQELDRSMGIAAENPSEYLTRRANGLRSQADLSAGHWEADAGEVRETRLIAAYADSLRAKLDGQSFEAQLAALDGEQKNPDRDIRVEALQYAITREGMSALSAPQLAAIYKTATEWETGLAAQTPIDPVQSASHQRLRAAIAVVEGLRDGHDIHAPNFGHGLASVDAMRSAREMEDMRQHVMPHARSLSADEQIAGRYRFLPFSLSTPESTALHVDADVAAYNGGYPGTAVPYLAAGLRADPLGPGSYGEHLRLSSIQAYDAAVAYNEGLQAKDARGYEELSRMSAAWITPLKVRGPQMQPSAAEVEPIFATHTGSLSAITDPAVRAEAVRVMDAMAEASPHYAAKYTEHQQLVAVLGQARAMDRGELRSAIDAAQEQVDRLTGSRAPAKDLQMAQAFLHAYEGAYFDRFSPPQPVARQADIEGAKYTYADYRVSLVDGLNKSFDSLPDAMRSYAAENADHVGNLHAQVNGMPSIVVIEGQWNDEGVYSERAVTPAVGEFNALLATERAVQQGGAGLAPTPELMANAEAQAVNSFNAHVAKLANTTALTQAGTTETVQVGSVDELVRASTADREVDRLHLIQTLQGVVAESAGAAGQKWANEAVVAMQRDEPERAVWALEKFSKDERLQNTATPVGPVLAEGIMEYSNRHHGKSAAADVGQAVEEGVRQSPVSEQRVYLAIPFRDKELAKQEAQAAGFKIEWDKERRAWHAPADADLSGLSQWRIGATSMQSAKTDYEIADDFGEALRKAGYHVEGPAIMDGKIHRVRVDGDRGAERSGAYAGYLEGERSAGYWENHRTKDRETWKVDGPVATVDPAQRAALNAQAAERREQQERERGERHVEAASLAQVLLSNAPPATADNAYCAKKGIETTGGLYTVPAAGSIDGVLIGNSVSETKELRKQNAGMPVFMKNDLLVPMRDFDGNTWSVQSINPSFKALMTGGRKTGLHCLAGSDVPFTESALMKNPSLPLIVAEGYATADSVSRMAGQPVIGAIDSGNLLHVVKELRDRFPDREIWIAADNDHAKEGKINSATGKPEINVGLVSAREAAKAVDGMVIAPTFAKTDKGSDWNDVYMKPDPTREVASTQWKAAVAGAQMQRASQQAPQANTLTKQQSEQQAQARQQDEQPTRKRGGMAR